MPIKYPTEFKVKAIRRYEKGESIKELCKELNILSEYPLPLEKAVLLHSNRYPHLYSSRI